MNPLEKLNAARLTLLADNINETALAFHCRFNVLKIRVGGATVIDNGLLLDEGMIAGAKNDRGFRRRLPCGDIHTYSLAFCIRLSDDDPKMRGALPRRWKWRRG